MARSIFYSFHYVPDNWRAAQVRNMGVVDGNVPAKDNDWESITKQGNAAIQSWIDAQLKGRSCSVVLIGTQTANRKWIDYEIKASWNAGKGLVGVYIHNLQNIAGQQATKGSNPFSGFTLKNGALTLSSIVKAYDPPHTDSKQVYAHIKNNLAAWIEEAITIREGYK